MTLAKYATNGNFLWAETNLSYAVDTGGTGVAVDSKDNAYIVAGSQARPCSTVPTLLP